VVEASEEQLTAAGATRRQARSILDMLGAGADPVSAEPEGEPGREELERAAVDSAFTDGD
jgi:hypothetical protein